MNVVANMTRPKGDPKIIRSGPSSLSGAERLGRALGWFSIGLGLVELLAPARITRTLGMEGKESLVRAFGAREIGHGIVSLSNDQHIGLWSRVAGDGIDIATLMTGLGDANPKRRNVEVAIAMLLGLTALDVTLAQAVTAGHARGRGRRRSYRGRSGFPNGVSAARGAARDFKVPDDMRAIAGSARAPSREAERTAPTEAAPVY